MSSGTDSGTGPLGLGLGASLATTFRSSVGGLGLRTARAVDDVSPQKGGSGGDDDDADGEASLQNEANTGAPISGGWGDSSQGPFDEDFFPNAGDGNTSGAGDGNSTPDAASSADAPSSSAGSMGGGSTIATLPPSAAPDTSSASSAASAATAGPSPRGRAGGGGGLSSGRGFSGSIGSVGQSFRALGASVSSSVERFEARCDEKLEKLENKIAEGVSAACKGASTAMGGEKGDPLSPSAKKTAGDKGAGPLGASKEASFSKGPLSPKAAKGKMDLAKGLASIRRMGSSMKSEETVAEGSSGMDVGEDRPGKKDASVENTTTRQGSPSSSNEPGNFDKSLPARQGTTGGIAGKLAESMPKLELPKIELPKIEMPAVPKMGMSRLASIRNLGGSGTTPKVDGKQKDKKDWFDEVYKPVDPVTTSKLVDPKTGDVYEGPVDALGIRHGDGAVVNRSDGSKFLGRYVNDKAHSGTFIRGEETYNGPLIDDWMYDTGGGSEAATVTRDEKEVGTLTKSDGTVYTGFFRSGLYQGKGKLTICGSSYEGMFLAGNYDGRGTLRASDGGSYAGTWRDGKKTGEGVEISGPSSDGQTRGEVYEGQFRDNARAGSGKLTLSNGTVVEGWWRRGEPADGPGWTIIYPDGGRYYGKAAKCKPDGMGTMKYGSSSADGGGAYSGEWRDGKRHGKGLRVYGDKTKEEGLWENDTLVEMKNSDEEVGGGAAER